MKASSPLIASFRIIISVALLQKTRSFAWGTTWPLLGDASTPPFDDIKKSWNEKDAERTCGEHAADHSSAYDLACDSSGALCRPQWDTTQDERKRSHQDRPQAKPGACERRVHHGSSVLEFVFGELDDQNRILCRKTDKHDQSDLRINIALDLDHVTLHEGTEQYTPQPQHGKRSEYGYRRTQQDTEWQRPAFVGCGQNQKNKQQREPEDHGRAHTFQLLLFLKRHVLVVVAHFRRHGLLEHFLQRRHSLPGAVSGRRTAVKLRAPIFVKPHDELRTGVTLDPDKGRERQVLSAVVPDIKLTDVLGVCAVTAFCLNIDLPLPAKLVEIVDEVPTHKRLNGFVDIADAHTLLENSVPVHVHELLWHVRQ